MLGLDINLSDHLPLMTIGDCDILTSSIIHNSKLYQSHLRWDQAPLHLFYEHTRLQLQPVLEELDWLLYTIDDVTVTLTIDHIYEKVVAKLCESANLFIPKHRTNFYELWWSQKLDVLKANAVSSCKAWKDAGKT